MTDHFDTWINGMTEEQYDNWLENDASEAQEEKALNIRTPLSEGELSEMEREQEFTPTSEIIEVEQPRKQPTIIYDNRDRPVINIPAIIRQEPTSKAPIVIPTIKISDRPIPTVISSKPVKQSIFRRFINLFRRKR